MTQTPINESAVLDTRGLRCPMPVIKTAKAMKQLSPGQVLKVISTDRGSAADIPAWAQSTHNELLEQREEAGEFVFLVRKGQGGRSQ